MTDLIKTLGRPFALLLGALGWMAAQAATFTQIPTVPNGRNCAALAVNDSGRTVGNCSQIGNNANPIPWVADAGSPQVALPSLATGQGCTVSYISNANWAMGSCNKTSSVTTGVIWKGDTPANPPVVLNPLPARTLPLPVRSADFGSVPTKMNERGDVVGGSVGEGRRYTPVLWAAGSGTPQYIFPAGLLFQPDGVGCTPVDVNLTLVNGYPSVALNCLGTAGANIARVATRGTSGYVITDLAAPAGANFCTVLAVNDALNVAGQCEYPNSTVNVPKAVSWPSPSSAPIVLTSAAGTASKSISIGNNGAILIKRPDGAGNTGYSVWVPLPTPIQLAVDIVLPAGYTTPTAYKIRYNGSTSVVVLSTVNTTQNVIAATWTLAAGVVPILPINGGLTSLLMGVSPSATYVVGVVKDSSQIADAVIATLP